MTEEFEVKQEDKDIFISQESYAKVTKEFEVKQEDKDIFTTQESYGRRRLKSSRWMTVVWSIHQQNVK